MRLRQEHLVVPDWPVPPGVQALQTTRLGGVSLPPYDSLNLGMHVGDDPLAVSANRHALSPMLPSEPVWLEQVHGTTVVLAESAGRHPLADACVTRKKNTVCVVMTADCLPVLLCDRAGTVAAAVHAGWRGLAGGVIEATVAAMAMPEEQLMAWLGPAIGPQAFEVGGEVREVFLAHDPAAATAFTPHAGKYLVDIYRLARQRLHAMGIMQIHGGGFCTHGDRERFFSYRRDGRTGRMGSFIWLS
ncbi:MAG TPA: peptidoglycan editing factor PgeF [Methylophilaceae bacterium]|nr:peptidoglycan editing factor PgeF [Methylophilaceae bacterium]HQR60534.1 peptidoglycan editing factor PgeF [Methylophilaceae bacterium]